MIRAIQPLLGRSSDDEALFEYDLLAMWVGRQQLLFIRVAAHFVLGDLRKFTEQYGDII